MNNRAKSRIHCIAMEWFFNTYKVTVSYISMHINCDFCSNSRACEWLGMNDLQIRGCNKYFHVFYLRTNLL